MLVCPTPASPQKYCLLSNWGGIPAFTLQIYIMYIEKIVFILNYFCFMTFGIALYLIGYQTDLAVNNVGNAGFA